VSVFIPTSEIKVVMLFRRILKIAKRRLLAPSHLSVWKKCGSHWMGFHEI
jgi:hypothetical protein